RSQNREGEQRNLVANQLRPRLAPPERPEVEQQKSKGQRHDHRLREKPQTKSEEHQNVSADARLLHITRIIPERKNPEKCAEDVFPFGDPGHRFPVQRMNSEDEGYKRARPHSLRHALENREQEQHAREMDRDTHQMM